MLIFLFDWEKNIVKLLALLRIYLLDWDFLRIGNLSANWENFSANSKQWVLVYGETSFNLYIEKALHFLSFI